MTNELTLITYYNVAIRFDSDTPDPFITFHHWAKKDPFTAEQLALTIRATNQ